MKSDLQLRENFYLRLDRENTTIILVFLWNEEEVEDNKRVAELVFEEVNTLLNTDEHQSYNVLVDLVPLLKEDLNSIAPDSYSIYMELMSHPRLRRVAFLGSNGFLGSLIGLLRTEVPHRERFEQFSDVRKAQEWLVA